MLIQIESGNDSFIAQLKNGTCLEMESEKQHFWNQKFHD